MTAARLATTASSRNGPPGDAIHREAEERTPWLFAFLCLLIPTMPSYVVLAGPLKSNGSPAKMIAFAFFGLALLGFVLIRRTATTRTLRPGVVIILAYFLLMLLVYGVGLSRLGSEIAEPNKTRVLTIVVANVGVALYALTRIKTARQRTIVLGCLAIGLTFNCAVGFLQTSVNVDLHLLFQPPGFIDNQTDQGRGFAAALTDRFGAKRAFGTSGHAIEFAVLSAITVPLTIHFARYAAKRQVRLFAALASGVALLATAAGVSRSGVIALTAALLIYVWTFTVRGLGVAVMAGVVAILGNLIAAPGNVEALWKTITNSAEDDSVAARIAAYAKVSQTLRDHPVFGLGLGANPAREYGWLDNEWMQSTRAGRCRRPRGDAYARRWRNPGDCGRTSWRHDPTRARSGLCDGSDVHRNPRVELHV